MYHVHEAARLRKEFWTRFGRYMAPVLSSEFEKINWVNYKTGVKGLSFSMQAGEGSAVISINITSSDLSAQERFFSQFLALKNTFRDKMGEDWVWCYLVKNENGQPISRIYKELDNVRVLRKEDWPALISFFKTRIILLDDFWNEVKHYWERLS